MPSLVNPYTTRLPPPSPTPYFGCRRPDSRKGPRSLGLQGRQVRAPRARLEPPLEPPPISKVSQGEGGEGNEGCRQLAELPRRLSPLNATKLPQPPPITVHQRHSRRHRPTAPQTHQHVSQHFGWLPVSLSLLLLRTQGQRKWKPFAAG